MHEEFCKGAGPWDTPAERAPGWGRWLRASIYNAVGLEDVKLLAVHDEFMLEHENVMGSVAKTGFRYGTMCLIKTVS